MFGSGLQGGTFNRAGQGFGEAHGTIAGALGAFFVPTLLALYFSTGGNLGGKGKKPLIRGALLLVH